MKAFHCFSVLQLSFNDEKIGFFLLIKLQVNFTTRLFHIKVSCEWWWGRKAFMTIVGHSELQVEFFFFLKMFEVSLFLWNSLEQNVALM